MSNRYPRYGEASLKLSGDGTPYVSKPFYFELAPGEIDVIYPGLRSDFASTHLAGLFISPWGPWSEAALVHDRDYKYGKVKKSVADKRFYNGVLARMEALGRTDTKDVLIARAMYTAVFTLGWIPWLKYRSRAI